MRSDRAQALVARVSAPYEELLASWPLSRAESRNATGAESAASVVVDRTPRTDAPIISLDPAIRLPDTVWEEVAMILPENPPRCRVSARDALDGILYILLYGRSWAAPMPEGTRCGSGMTCWRKLRLWQQLGAWARVRDVLCESWAPALAVDWARAEVHSDRRSASRGPRYRRRNG